MGLVELAPPGEKSGGSGADGTARGAAEARGWLAPARRRHGLARHTLGEALGQSWPARPQLAELRQQLFAILRELWASLRELFELLRVLAEVLEQLLEVRPQLAEILRQLLAMLGRLLELLQQLWEQLREHAEHLPQHAEGRKRLLEDLRQRSPRRRGVAVRTRVSTFSTRGQGRLRAPHLFRARCFKPFPSPAG